MKKIRCYHWSRNNDCLGYGDGRKIVLGETLSVDGTPSLCDYGLHGSTSIVDALGYAAGSHLWVVDIWGKVDIQDDKLCGQHRQAMIEYGDLLPIIVEFAYWCADRARQYAAKYAAKSAESSAEYAAKYAAKYAEYAAKYAAKYAESAEYAAKYAAEYAAKSAESAEYAAKSAESEKVLQEHWWTEKLSQIK